MGENVADRARAAGLSAAIVESELVGGECSYWACMPSKALLRPVIARADARRVPGLRHSVEGPLDATRSSRTATSTPRTGRTTARSAGWRASASTCTAATAASRAPARSRTPRRTHRTPAPGPPRGGRLHRHPRRPADLPGLADVKPWTSREATAADHVPGRLLVVGGGVVAVEMATAWQALGSHVTVLVRGGGLLPRMEPFAGELVQEALTETGAEVRCGVSVTAVERENGTVTATLDDGSALQADEILFATGRAPRTDDIGLETVGLEPGSWLPVDESLRVDGSEWLYAVGDANHRALLTHQGKYQARVAGAAVAARAQGVPLLETDRWGAHSATADHAAVPQVVFTDPEAASAGLTLAEAEAAGHRVRAVDYDMSGVAGAGLYADGYRGRARMIVDLDREILLGVTFVGPGVGELIHSATVAVAGEVPLERLWHAVPAYPTISEVWLRLLETYRG